MIKSSKKIVIEISELTDGTIDLSTSWYNDGKDYYKTGTTNKKDFQKHINAAIGFII